MPFCTSCGASLKETDKFCSDCGQPAQQRQPTPADRQVTPRKQVDQPREQPEKDEMLVTLDTTTIRRGGTINGQATLNLAKPQKKGLYVRLELYAEHHKVEKDWDEVERSFQRIYEHIEYLDGEKEYPAGSHVYNFSITVPENLEEWRMKRESVLMKKLGFKKESYLDETIYDPRILRWYLLLLFKKRQLGIATIRQTHLTFAV